MSALRFAEVLGEQAGSSARSIFRTFDRMGIAEEEIATMQRRLPRASMRDKSDDLYRLHCRELLGRVARGGDVAPGTDAEVLVTLSEASLAAPLSALYTLVAARVFNRLFPDRPDVFEGVGDRDEPYRGAAAEAEADVRRRCADESRREFLK